MPLEEAMTKLPKSSKKPATPTLSRQPSIDEEEKTVNQVLAIASLGGATIDDEWNYIHQKLMRAAGVVSIENQARI